MDFAQLTPLLDWVADHPRWAGALVGLVAFTESLALVGLFVPGAVFMFVAGALIGVGRLELWPVLAWAAGGAVLGDGVSFWLGRHYHQRLRVMWPLRRHPRLVARATDLFHRHGGKGVFVGRFIGPIRPVIPAVAGMLEMPAPRFFVVNVLSAVLWAPAYLLPGLVFAASLDLAAEVAARLAALVVVLAVVLFLAGWAVRKAFKVLHPRTHRMIRAALAWSRRHPVLGELPAAVLDPGHTEARGLTLLALLLAVAGTGFLLVLRNLVGLTRADQAVHDGLQALRTPVMDQVMVAVTELGDGRVLTAVFAVVLAVLAGRRHWHAAGHWVAAAAFTAVLVPTLQWTLDVPRPPGFAPVADYPAFPSAHTAHATAVYGFLAVLIGRELGDMWRWTAYAATGLLVTAIAFSRLYLGAHWLSDVLGGLSLALAWVALLGIAYRRHPREPLSRGGLTATAVLGLALAGTWNALGHFEDDLRRYTPHRPVTLMAEDAWWREAWRRLPAYRADLGADSGHPLSLQYAGPLAPLAERLEADGWREPPTLTAVSWLRWFAADAGAGRMPVLPQVHDGRHEALLRVQPLADGEAMLALRLWRTDITLTPGGQPLYVGNVSRLTVLRPAGLVAVPRTDGGFAAGLDAVRTALAPAGQQALQLRGVRRGMAGDGLPVLLLRSTGRPGD